MYEYQAEHIIMANARNYKCFDIWTQYFREL